MAHPRSHIIVPLETGASATPALDEPRALRRAIQERLEGADAAQLAEILDLIDAHIAPPPAGPDAPPELWRPRGGARRETPPAFIARVYGPWLDGRFTRRDLRQLDPKCVRALENWIQRNGEPNDLNLPTLSERNDHLLQAAEETAPPPGSRAAERLRSARRRRRVE